MRRLSLEQEIYDSILYPDTRVLSDPVMDIRIVNEQGLLKVKNSLDSKKYLKYTVDKKDFTDD